MKKQRMNWIKDSWLKAVKDARVPRKQRWMAALLIVLALLSFWRTGHFLWTGNFIGYMLASLGVLGLVLPVVLFPILCLWFFIGNVFGEIASFVLLLLIYFLAAWPISLFRKKNTDTGWIKIKEETHDYTKPY